MTAAFETNLTDRDEQAAFWCQCLAEGALDAEAQASFDRWISDPANARALEDAIRVWKAMDEVAEHPQLIRMRSAALDSFRRASRGHWSRRIAPRWYGISAIAACLALVFLGSVLLLDPAQAYRTGLGERRVAMLEDGSKISLDADTRLEVRMESERRDLTLTRGRAKFDVAKDPLRPFSVTAGDKIVVATGTSFSVEVLDGQVHVLLYEGHVAILDRISRKPVPQQLVGSATIDDQLLVPGRELVAPIGAARPALVESADLQQSLSWGSGQLTFEDEPLATAVVRMNRYSKRQLVVGDATAAATRVTGVFNAGDVDAFVEGVTMLTPLHATQTDGVVTFRRN